MSNEPGVSAVSPSLPGNVSADSVTRQLERNPLAEEMTDLTNKINSGTESLEQAVKDGKSKEEIEAIAEDQRRNMEKAKRAAHQYAQAPRQNDSGPEVIVKVLLQAIKNLLAALFRIGSGPGVDPGVSQSLDNQREAAAQAESSISASQAKVSRSVEAESSSPTPGSR